MTVRSFTVPVTTDGSGVATAYSPAFSGFIESIQYVKTDFADGVDFTITAKETGEAIWSATNQNSATIVRPRAATHSTAGVAALYAAAGVAVNDKIALGRDRVKIAIAQGGATKTGVFVITVDDGH
jgi:hypothetical protein